MDLGTIVGLGAIVVLVLANAFFVATEFALVAVRRPRLEQLAQEGHAKAALAREIVQHLDAYIAACQLGITMASLALGWIGEPALAGLIAGTVERLGGRLAPAAAHTVAVAVAFCLITAIHIVIGELAPKGLALQRTEATAMWIARPIRIFYVLFRWPIGALNAVGNGVLRLLGLPPSTGHEMVHTAEELRFLVRASQEAGLVEESEARIARRAFRFADLTAGALMTPRTEVEGLPVGTSRDEVLSRFARSGHSRLVVYDGSLDHIVGVVHVRDVLAPSESSRFDLRRLVRPPVTVPETRHADDLLEDMRDAGSQLAAVVDEYGGTAGIVTIGDLLEALVGPIGNEEPARGVIVPRREPDGSILLDGLMRLDEFQEFTGIRPEPEELASVDTLNGLVMAHLDRLPKPGDEVVLGGHRLRVERLQGQRVQVARLLPRTRPGTSAEGEGGQGPGADTSPATA